MEYRGYVISFDKGAYLIEGNGVRILQATYFPYAGETVEDKAKAHVDALITRSENEAQHQVDLSGLEQRLIDTENALIELASLLGGGL